MAGRTHLARDWYHLWAAAVAICTFSLADGDVPIAKHDHKANLMRAETEPASSENGLDTAAGISSSWVAPERLPESPLAMPAALGSGSCFDRVTHGWPSNMTLSQEQLRRGAVNLNGAFRLRPLLHKLHSGKRLRVLVVGGACEDLQTFNESVVHTPVTPIDQRWPTLVSKWLSGANNSQVDFFSMQQNSVPLSSPSSFNLSSKWNTLLRKISKYDLVFVAGSVNFPLKSNEYGFPFTKERSVRRSFDEMILREMLAPALDTDNAPAVMLVEWFYSQKMGGEAVAQKAQEKNHSLYLFRHGLEFNYSTWEDESYSFLANYYEVSMVSARNALLHSVDIESSSDVPIGPRFQPDKLWTDGIHPSHLGYALWAQTIEFAICQQFELLQEKGESPATNSSLPPAVFNNPAVQLALRRGSEASGFGEFDMTISMSNDAYAWTDIVPDSVNASTFTSELHVTLLPLVILEGCAFLGVGQCSERISSSASPCNSLHTFALEPFRFLGVLHIVLMHEIMQRPDDSWWRKTALFGKYWVQFFFALSGFVLYISQGGARTVSDPAFFVIKRIRGVYFSYMIGTAMALSIAEEPVRAAWNYILQDNFPGFLMLDSWTYPYGSTAPDGPAWFVCTLLAFWCCFPHWYRFLHGCKWPRMALLFAYLSTFGLPALYVVLNLGYSCHPCVDWTVKGGISECPCRVWGGFAEFHPLSNWQTFFFGMCLGRILQETDLAHVLPELGKVGGTISIFLLLSLPRLVPAPANAPSTLLFDKGPLLLPVFGMLIFFVSLGQDILLKPSILKSPFLKYLGEMSSQLFLLHWPVRMIVYHVSAGASPVCHTLALQLLVAVVAHEAQKAILGPSRSETLDASKEGADKPNTEVST